MTNQTDLTQLLTDPSTDAWNDAGGLRLTLGAEELGVLTDALIGHLAASAARKSRNPASTSDLRGEICAALMARLDPKTRTEPEHAPADDAEARTAETLREHHQDCGSQCALGHITAGDVHEVLVAHTGSAPIIGDIGTGDPVEYRLTTDAPWRRGTLAAVLPGGAIVRDDETGQRHDLRQRIRGVGGGEIALTVDPAGPHTDDWDGAVAYFTTEIDAFARPDIPHEARIHAATIIRAATAGALPGPVHRRVRAAEDTADAAVLEDWTQSTVPPPLLGVEGVEPGEPHIPLVMIGDDLGNDDGRAVRNLTAAQARDLAALLDTRADVLDPPAGGRR